LTGERTVLGTLSYMSQEQAIGKTVDVRSDISSLGMTLFFLLSGRTAFTARNLLEQVEQQTAGPPPDLSGVVPGLTNQQASIIRVMLVRCHN
jgi:eukaryotic-like serine/threonine-protein kinase